MGESKGGRTETVGQGRQETGGRTGGQGRVQEEDEDGRRRWARITRARKVVASMIGERMVADSD